MADEHLKKLLTAFRRLSPRDWGVMTAKSIVSEAPLVGGVLSDIVSLATDKAPAEPLLDIVVAAATFEPGRGIITGRGLSSYTDNGTGDFTFSFTRDCEDYIVNAQIDGAGYDVIEQNAGGFRIRIFNRTNPTLAVDQPVKFLVLNASEAKGKIVP